MESTDKPGRGWGLALITVGAIGLLLGSAFLIAGQSTPWVLLVAIACLSLGLWVRRQTRTSPTTALILVIALGFFAIAAALLGVAVRNGIRGSVGRSVFDLVGAGGGIFAGIRGIGKFRAMRRAQGQN